MARAAVPGRLIWRVATVDATKDESATAIASARDGTRVSPLTLTYLYTRAAPAGMPVGRINAGTVAAAGWPPDSKPAVFICGPTGLVEAAADLLAAAATTPRRSRQNASAPRADRPGPSSRRHAANGPGHHRQAA